MTERLRVLCVDDDSDVRHIFGLSLRLDPSIEVRAVSDGRQALDLIQKGSWTPDCVLTDISMPGLNGVDLLLALKRESRDHDLSVVITSARIAVSDVERYVALGACGVIEKPFDAVTLAAQVRAFCCQERASAGR